MTQGWLTTSIGVPVLLTIATALMFGPDRATHWISCALFLASAAWIGIMGIIWFRKADKSDWTVWLRGGALTAAIILGTPTLTYFALPAQGQTPSPEDIRNGNCNVIGNNNVNCTQINLAPKPRSLANPASQAFREQLTAIPKGSEIAVTALIGDSEAYNLALQVYDFMKSNGYKMKEDGAAQAVFATPLIGVAKYIAPDGTIDIQIGSAH